MKKISISTVILFAVFCVLFANLSYGQRSRKADSVDKFFIGTAGGFDSWPYCWWLSDSANVAIRNARSVFGPLSCDTCQFKNYPDTLNLNAETRNFWDYPSKSPTHDSIILGGSREPYLDVLMIEPDQLFSAFRDAAYMKFEFERHAQMHDSVEYPGFLDHSGLVGRNDSIEGTSPLYLTGTTRQTPFKSVKLEVGIDSQGVFNDSLWHRGFVSSGHTPAYYFRGNEQKKLLFQMRIRADTLSSPHVNTSDTVLIMRIKEYAFKENTTIDSLTVDRINSFIVAEFTHRNSDFDTLSYRFIHKPDTRNISISFEWKANVNLSADWLEVMTAHIDTSDDTNSINANGSGSYALHEVDANSGEDFLNAVPVNLLKLVDSVIARYSPDTNHHYVNYIRIGDEFGLAQALPFKRLVKLFRQRSGGRIEVVPYLIDSSLVGINNGVLCDGCFGGYLGGKMGIPNISQLTNDGARLGWVDTSLYADPKVIFFDPYPYQKGMPLPKRTTHTNADSIIAWENTFAATNASSHTDSSSGVAKTVFTPYTDHYSRDSYRKIIQSCAMNFYLKSLRTSHRWELRNQQNKSRYGILWQAGVSPERINQKSDFTGINCLRFAACLRPPTGAEMQLGGHLATSCGAAGLLLYLLTNHDDDKDGQNGGIMSRTGEHSSNTHTFSIVGSHDTTVQTMWTGWKERFDMCVNLFPTLKEYGTILLHSKYIGDWRASELFLIQDSTIKAMIPFKDSSIVTMDDTLLKDVFSPDFGIDIPDTSNRTFVHISMWVDTLGGASDTLLYITNMRTDDSYDTTEVPTTIDRRLITMKMKAPHVIEDVAFPQGAQLDNEKIWTPYVGTQTGDSLKLFLKAGDGILIRLADTSQGTMRQTRIAINYPKNGSDFNDHGRVVFNRPVPGVLDKTNSAKWSIPSSSRPYIVGIPDTTTAKMWQDSLLYQTFHSSRMGWWRHQNWTELTNPTSTKTFDFKKQLSPLPPGATQRNPHFSTDSIAHKITIRTDLEGQGIGGTRLRVFDPWYVDETYLRNFNQIGDTMQQNSPFLPHVLTSGVQPGAGMSGYGGVFLKQDEFRTALDPNYSLSAYNTIKPGTLIHTDTFPTYTDWSFIHWWTNDSASHNDPTPWVSTDDGNVNFEPKNNPIFMKDSAIYIARYKAHMATFESATDIGFDHNNQRKLFYLFTDSLNRRWYRIVYSSGGRIFAANGYRTGPNNNDIHWNRDELISKWDTDECTNEFPSMGYHETPQDTSFHYTWLQRYTSGYDAPSIQIGTLINGYPRIYDTLANYDQNNYPLDDATPAIASVDGPNGKLDVVAWETENGICVRAVGGLGSSSSGVRTAATGLILGNGTARHPTVWVDDCDVCDPDSNVFKFTIAWDMDSLSYTNRNIARNDTVRDVWTAQYRVRYFKTRAPFITIDSLPSGGSNQTNLSLQLRPNSTDNRNPCISGARYASDTTMIRIAYETDIHPDTDNVVKQGITVAHKRSGFNWNMTKFFQTSNVNNNKYWKPSIEVQRYHDSSGTLLTRDNYYSLVYERSNGTAIQHWAMDNANQRVVSHIYTSTRHPQLAVVKNKVDSNTYRMCLANDGEPHWLISGYTGLYKYGGNDTLWGYHAIVESDSTETLTVEYGYGEPTVDDGSGSIDLELVERADTLNVDTDHAPEYFTASEHFTLPATGTFTWYPWVHTSSRSTYQSAFDTVVYVLDFYDTTGSFVARLDSLILCDSVPNILGETRSITITRDSAEEGYVTFRRLTDGLVTSTARWEPIIMTERLSDNGAYKRVGRSYVAGDNGIYLEVVPNPTSGETDISFIIPNDGPVTLEAYNTLGNNIASIVQNSVMKKGRHIIHWNTANLAPGVYPIMLRFGNYRETLRVIVLR